MADSRFDGNGADPDVVQLMEKGDSALASLFAQYRARLRRMVEMRLDHRVAGRVDPSDVLQEVFLDASKQLSGYLAEMPMPPLLWLRFLTRQRLMATHRYHLGVQMRNAKREVPLERGQGSPWYSESLSRHLAGQFTTPSGAMARMELQAQLQEVLDAMEPLDQEILALRHFEELSNNEVAQELGISKAAASNRYTRALVRLGRLLGGRTSPE